MDKIFGAHENDGKVSIAGDQAEYQQQQSSTLSNGDKSAAGHKKKVFFGLEVSIRDCITTR
jgi:hypothetical protein